MTPCSTVANIGGKKITILINEKEKARAFYSSGDSVEKEFADSYKTEINRAAYQKIQQIKRMEKL